MSIYYDVSLKEYMLEEIESLAQMYSQVTWMLTKGDLTDKMLIEVNNE